MDLPDIKGKVKITTAGMAEADAEAKAFARSVKSSLENSGVDRFGKQAGSAFLQFSQSGELASLRISSSTARSRADFDALEQRAKKMAESLDKEMLKGSRAVIRLSEDGEASLANVSHQLQATGTSATQAAGGLSSLGGGVIVLAAAAAILAEALAPVVVLLGSFAVGLTGALAVMTLGLGIIGALGAGVLLLGQRTQAATQAQQNAAAAQQALTKATNDHAVAVKELETLQASLKGHRATADQLQLLADLQERVKTTSYEMVAAQNAVAAAGEQATPPLQKFTDHVGQLLDRLGTKAAPLMQPILNLLTGIADKAEAAGEKVIAAFGGRLPATLDLADGFLTSMGNAFNRLGPVATRFLDAFLARGPQLNAIFARLLDVGVGAVDGLLKNLLRLSDWFTARLPTLGPQVAAIFGAIGVVIQGLADAWGRASDFFQANGPAMGNAAKQVFDAIVAGWQFAQPAIGLALAAFHLLDPAIQFIREHADSLKPVLYAVGVLLAVMAAGAVLAAAPVVILTYGIVALASAASALVTWLRDHIPAAISVAGVALVALASWVQGAVGAIEGAIGAVGRLASAIRNLPVVGGIAAALGIPGAAAGGSFLPGSVFRVGEEGPELAYARPGGGVVVVPESGGGRVSHYNLTLHGAGAVNDPEGVRRMLQRMTALGVTA